MADAMSVITDAIPALAEHLFAARPGRVYREAVAVIERPLLSHALAITGGNQLQAARLLGMNRNTLHKHCRQLNLVGPRAELDGRAS